MIIKFIVIYLLRLSRYQKLPFHEGLLSKIKNEIVSNNNLAIAHLISGINELADNRDISHWFDIYGSIKLSSKECADQIESLMGIDIFLILINVLLRILFEVW
jgi:hypothetical protein